MTASGKVAIERLPHYGNRLVASTACPTGRSPSPRTERRGENQIEPSAHAMLGPGLLARGAGLSGPGVRAGMTQREPHNPDMDKIIINFGSPFGP
jgi:hypothetical protein